jgi:hypothetical protein
MRIADDKTEQLLADLESAFRSNKAPNRCAKSSGRSGTESVIPTRYPAWNVSYPA